MFNLTISLSSRFVFLHSSTRSSPPTLRHSFFVFIFALAFSLSLFLSPPSSLNILLLSFSSSHLVILLPSRLSSYLLPLSFPPFSLTHVFLFSSLSFSFALSLLCSLSLFSITQAHHFSVIQVLFCFIFDILTHSAIYVINEGFSNFSLKSLGIRIDRYNRFDQLTAPTCSHYYEIPLYAVRQNELDIHMIELFVKNIHTYISRNFITIKIKHERKIRYGGYKEEENKMS